MTAETDSVGSPWLFLLGVSAFLGSAALSVYDLASGDPVLRGLLANAAATALVFALAGRRMLSTPDSHTDSRSEAARVTLFFYGFYLVAVGVVLLVTVADRRLAGGSLATGTALVSGTYLTGGDPGIADRLSTLVGLSGVGLVVGSAVLFVHDLVTGVDLLRGIAANGVGAVLFVLWTAYDMPADPDSGVETTADALGVAMTLYSVYLLVAGAVLALTGLFAHTRGTVGLLYLALGAVTLVVGVVFAPLPASGGSDPDSGSETTADDG